MTTESTTNTQLTSTGWHAAARVDDLPGSGTYVLADVDGEQAIVIRGRDGTIRAFHNVCKHRGAQVL